jgi:hypothetical protein
MCPLLNYDVVAACADITVHCLTYSSTHVLYNLQHCECVHFRLLTDASTVVAV